MSTNKDRGYAWWILFMSFLSHVCNRGFSFGILGNMTIAHQKFFNIGLQESGIIGSLHVASIFIFGKFLNSVFLKSWSILIAAPLASIMVKKLGCRTVEIFGGCCLILGFGLSSLSTQSWHAFMLFSLLAGIGVSSTYMASSTILTAYFQRFSYFAFSLAILGTFIGSTVWPIGSQYLLDTYGYSKAMGFIAISHLIHFIAGASFIPPNNTQQSSEGTKLLNLDNVQDYYAILICCLDKRISELSASERKPTNEMQATPTDEIPREPSTNELQEKAETSTVKEVTGGSSSQTSISRSVEQDSAIEKCDVTFTNSAFINSSEDKLSEGGEKLTTDGEPISSDSSENCAEEDPSLKKDLLSLIKSSHVWMLMVNAFFWSATRTTFHVLINNYIAHRLGISEREAALSITIFGGAKLAGSVIAVLISPLKFDRPMLRFITIMVYSICTIIISFSTSKEMYYILLSIWGVNFALSLGNLLAVLLDVIGARLLPLLLGIELLASGLGSLLGTAFYTFIGENTEELYSLISAGCGGIIGSIILLPLVISRQRQKHVASKQP
ncbi:hypothetical protein EB796_016752 [Bugula neritina]|uniref:Uncharacterized protein n=1 Tax=Bugula neritina TaxID=10212 RepID=A0A7J7JFL3_BUGNE|nr:hypothetical protein EB796_016752 [Bugula neritina]